MFDDWITIAEISKRTGVAESSVRRYISFFGKFLIGRKFGRSQVFHPNVCNVISKISKGYKNGKTMEEVSLELLEDISIEPKFIEKQEYPVIIKNTRSQYVHEDTNLSEKSVLDVQTQVLVKLCGILNQLLSSTNNISDQLEAQKYESINKVIIEIVQNQIKGLEEEQEKSSRTIVDMFQEKIKQLEDKINADEIMEDLTLKAKKEEDLEQRIYHLENISMKHEMELCETKNILQDKKILKMDDGIKNFGWKKLFNK